MKSIPCGFRGRVAEDAAFTLGRVRAELARDDGL